MRNKDTCDSKEKNLNINEIIKSMDKAYDKMYDYKANSPTDVIDSHQDLDGILEDHIII